jgi:IS6 family transposase
VRWYLRYLLSLRDVEELLIERGPEADHTTIWRWVQRYGLELQQRLRRDLKPTKKSRRVDETYIRVKGSWRYLYRAIDSTGATIDFLLSALRDAVAAKHCSPRRTVIRRIRNRASSTLIRPASTARRLPAQKRKGPCTLRHRCRHRPVQYLNNILEQDHRAIKRRVKAKQSFREFQAAQRTIESIGAINRSRDRLVLLL